jgi:hypothetical protein
MQNKNIQLMKEVKDQKELIILHQINLEKE